MARLMSQVKGGYYAAAPEAVAAVLERLRPPARVNVCSWTRVPEKARHSCNWHRGSRRFLTASSCRRIVPPWCGNHCPRARRWPRPISSVVQSLPIVFLHLVQSAL